MIRKISLLAASLLLAIGGMVVVVQAQVGGDELEDGLKRLFPASGNPDGTLNCKPKCDLLGPCC